MDQILDGINIVRKAIKKYEDIKQRNTNKNTGWGCGVVNLIYYSRGQIIIERNMNMKKVVDGVNVEILRIIEEFTYAKVVTRPNSD